MATDSTELTFVRCPSCRSLVPAVSTRCRMCGATLDAAAKAEESEASQPRRVRQRTMSQPNSELSSAAQNVRVEVPAEQPGAMEADPLGGGEIDPLAEYLDSDDAGFDLTPTAAEPAVAGGVTPEPAIDPFSLNDEEYDIFGEEEDAGWTVDAEEAPVKSAPVTEPVKAEPMFRTMSKDVGVPEMEVAPVAPFEPKDEPRAVPQPPPAKPPVSEPAPTDRPRVMVESGARQGGKPSGLSFGKGRQADPRQAKPAQREEEVVRETRQPQPPVEEAPPRPDRSERNERNDRNDRRDRGDRREAREDRRPQNQGGNQKPEGDRRQEPRGPAPQQKQEQRQEAKPERRDEQKQDQPRHQRPAQAPQQQQRRPEVREQRETRPPREESRATERQAPARGGESAPHITAQGMLRGWFVSYDQADGKAIDLREGRFFLSASSLKGNDLVVDHPSISTPHAMLTVAEGGGLHIQDLMSEQGIQLRKSRGNEYQQMNEPFVARNGDWVRFGEVEYRVVLIPGSSEE